ncbi:MAG: hypothetical protein Kow0069_36020 [Promethearchaeota archaeon]
MKGRRRLSVASRAFVTSFAFLALVSGSAPCAPARAEEGAGFFEGFEDPSGLETHWNWSGSGLAFLDLAAHGGSYSLGLNAACPEALVVREFHSPLDRGNLTLHLYLPGDVGGEGASTAEGGDSGRVPFLRLDAGSGAEGTIGVSLDQASDKLRVATARETFNSWVVEPRRWFRLSVTWGRATLPGFTGVRVHLDGTTIATFEGAWAFTRLALGFEGGPLGDALLLVDDLSYDPGQWMTTNQPVDQSSIRWSLAVAAVLGLVLALLRLPSRGRPKRHRKSSP